MKLFTVGPVMMHPETLEIAGNQLPYFRTEEFSNIMLETEKILKKLLFATEDYKAAFLTASGTGAMDATVANCFTKSDRLLIINGGSFGHRFVEIADTYGIPNDHIDLEFGERLTLAHLSKYEGVKYAALLVNLDETSTGQLYDIHLLSKFCREHGMYLVVDAISAFLTDEIKMDEDCIDVIILSSQKALSLSPGVSMVMMSPRIYQDRIQGRTVQTYYLNLERHVVNQIRGQTPFTPAVGTLLELHDMVKRIDAIGVERKIAETKEKAEYFRKIARENGFRIPDYPLSNAVTPIVFEGGAYELFIKLVNTHSVYVTPSGGDFKDKILRIGHMGCLSKNDYDELISLMKEAVR